MEIRDTDIKLSRCDNHECNEMLFGIAIVIDTPHGEIELCTYCIDKAKQLCKEEDNRIWDEIIKDP